MTFCKSLFLCDSVGEAKRTLTERELKVGLEARCISLNEAIEKFYGSAIWGKAGYR